MARCPAPSGWTRLSSTHCVDSREPSYENTYAWELAKPVAFHEPVPYEHRQGVVVWALA